MKFINDDWLTKRAELTSKRNNQGSPTLISLLKGEVETLNNRVTNLNTFKNLFFSIQEQLINEKEKNKTLKKVINQQRFGEPVAASVLAKLDSEDSEDNLTDEEPETNEHPAIVCIPSDEEEFALSNEDLTEAKDLILLSLAITNEYNLLIDNLIATSEANSFTELTEHILNTLKKYDLTGAIQIRSKFGPTNECTDEDKKAEYQSLIDQLKSTELVKQYDEFYIFNHQHISLIINGLPTSTEISERYIDYIKRAVTACENKIVALDNKRHLNNQHKNLKSLVDGTYTSITQIQKASKDQSDNIKNIFTTMDKEMSDFLNTIELSAQDKKNILSIIQTKRKSLTETLNDNISLDEKFVGVIKQLKHSFTKPKEL